ncbi:MAG: glycoside hydrolase family 97 N-terminal domain-containing protein, partial [Draconibacterium sp.]|nr:glycoside hydrolase family 97 N-terminal domain-containing protein [Draconibacterium sp.]
MRILSLLRKVKKVMNFNKIIIVICLLTAAVLLNSCNTEKKVNITSPNGDYKFDCFVNKTTGELSYSVNFLGKEIIKQSVLGFNISNFEQPHNITINSVTENNVNSHWQPVYGEKNEYPEIYSEKIISVSDNQLNYKITVRAYNEGVAFRWNFLNSDLTLVDEKTEFVLPDNVVLWASENAQSKIFKIGVSSLKNPIDRPLLIQTPDSLFIAIGEAGLVNFARMKFIKSSTKESTLKAKLDSEVKYQKPFETPWRYIMAGTKPGHILENNFLILNLNQPNKIEDTSWIKPGKIIREVTLTTKGGLACVDFAAKHNIQFVEFDAGWYGYEYDDKSDATTITIDPKRSKGPLDLHKIIKYAESKNIGIVLYVNRRSLEKQLDEILSLFKSWGIKGVKYGFVNVGSQEWTAWLHDAVRKAANHKLMVDIHDEYRPTGYSRTYPNLMTQEGIRGDEASPDNEMVLKTIFTRMIAGAGDHTNCYFDKRVDE